jgi:signal transduction histidine kinase
MLNQLALSPEHRTMLAGISPRSYMVVPLRARARPLGVLAFAITESTRSFTPADLDVARELGHRAALAVENAQHYQAAQKAINLRDQFLSIAAHELRTPLTALLGFSGLLKKQISRGRWNEATITRTANTIAAQAERLSQLVGELLDVTRLQRGQFALNAQLLDLVPLVARVLDEMALAQSAGDAPPILKLVAPEDPVLVMADPIRMEAVVQNLVSNAVKYGPERGIVEVRVGCQEGNAVLEVTDQGIGIPEEARARLFEPFFRAGNVGPRTSGLGIGLYIVQEIVARHGGRISVMSAEGTGSTFRVTLPLHAPEPAQPIS